MAWTFIRRAAVAAMLACAVSAGSADAQVYPAKPIRIIVPSGPGGPPDIVARLIAPHMQAALAQTVVVEDRTGASGAIGARAVATAEADGYTLLIGFPSPLAIIPAIMRNAGFDPRKDFTAVARLTELERRSRRQSEFPGKIDRGVGCARQGPSRQIQLCLGGPRQPGAPHRRIAAPERRHRPSPCSVQERRRNDDGRHRRTSRHRRFPTCRSSCR